MITYEILLLAISLIIFAIGIYAVVRNYAIDTIGELRYMLRCAKERREIVAKNNVDAIKFSDAEINFLEQKIENHWGRKLAGNYKSVFDFIPTPNEDPNGRMLRWILEK